MSVPSNYSRLISLATEVFAAHNDPDQLDVDGEVIAQLQQLHPSTMGEESDENGPVAWLLVIPTTTDLMERFLRRDIGETRLLEQTPEGIPYDAIYLCSALVLPEYRRKGIAKRLAMEAVSAIRSSHPVRTIFTWSFTKEGKELAERIAVAAGLPLRERRQA